jgi:hypothetical protein
MNQKRKISAKIIEDSIAHVGTEHESRLTTFELTYPRTILAEVNTHCVLSKNTASSRAIPVKKRVESVKENPALPVWIGENCPGMQAQTTNLQSKKILEKLHDNAIEQANFASILDKFNIHKQIVNRVMEPYTWITQVLTGTNWLNFFTQRCDEHADPNFDVLAGLMLEQYLNSEPRLKSFLESTAGWHTPYAPMILIKDLSDESIEIISKFGENFLLNHSNNTFFSRYKNAEIPYGQLNIIGTIARILYSVAACARVSYEKHATSPTPDEQIKFVVEKVIKNGHWSPTQHQGQAYPVPNDSHLCHMIGEQLLFELNQNSYIASPKSVYSGNFRNWRQFRKLFVCENFDFTVLRPFNTHEFLGQRLEEWKERIAKRGIEL